MMVTPVAEIQVATESSSINDSAILIVVAVVVIVVSKVELADVLKIQTQVVERVAFATVISVTLS